MRGIHRNLRQENQLIVDLIYTFLVRVSTRGRSYQYPWQEYTTQTQQQSWIDGTRAALLCAL